MECPICLSEKPVSDSIKCLKCTTSFCKSCAYTWKITNNTCPMKCPAPWDIDIDTKEYDGFIFCPACRRIGSILCPKLTCRYKIIYEKNDNIKKKMYFCMYCQGELEYYHSKMHENCDYWQSSFYFYCGKCDKKFCDCIEGREN